MPHSVEGDDPANNLPRNLLPAPPPDASNDLIIEQPADTKGLDATLVARLRMFFAFFASGSEEILAPFERDIRGAA
ncbi:hypothetical protein [Microvirga pakistanensis]|uniref:hypothetical protein n=1 Tax=Microvirga pakistanensis TaxID=1682650 RepID=UPI00106D4372|nr:hypothetical protein [Microvirga pakistanensis]